MLTVVKAILASPVTTFSFVVPGAQRWTVLTVVGTVTRAAGGTPNRAYQLTVTDGTTTVAAVGADDAGTDPGTCTVTWANTPGGTTASGAVGVSAAPLPNLRLSPGYVITGTILSPVAGDTWASAVVWYDFAWTSARVTL